MAAAQFLACGLLTIACAGPHHGPEIDDIPRNLLLVTLDTLRADRLSAYGYERPTSPHLDELASRSTVFVDTTCSIPTTLPSHLSIFTGLHPQQHGVVRNGTVPERDLLTLFDLLGAQGKKTAAVVASGVVATPFLQGLGFAQILDQELEEHGHQLPGSVVSERAGRWLEEHGREPFALWVHYFDTHEPYTPAPPYAQTFAGNYGGALPSALSNTWLSSLNRLPKPELSVADRQYVSDLYDAEVAQLDSFLGSLLAKLQDLDLVTDTMIVVVGDHGQALGEQERWGHGEWLLQPIIQVPFLIHLPGQTNGRQSRAAVETLDILPTLVEIFDLALPEDQPASSLPGRSLAPALRGEPLRSARARLVMRRHYEATPERRGLALLRGEQKWTLMREVDGDHLHLGLRSGSGGLDGENHYRDDAAAQEFLALSERLLAGARRLEPLSEETRSMLQSLGYVSP